MTQFAMVTSLPLDFIFLLQFLSFVSYFSFYCNLQSRQFFLLEVIINFGDFWVEELASLVKDNLPCKHLILSVEKALVDFLQDDTSSDEVLELEPMNSYNRLLLHRLADIFGFAHESVGEGDDRHILLERCPETSIPSILVGDILWQHEPQSLTTSHQLLRRKEALPVLKTATPSLPDTFEQREAAYLAARERIFSADAGNEREPVRQKPRNVPVVARRMIAHALGQRITSRNEDATVKTCGENEGQREEMHNQDSEKADSNSSLEGSPILQDKNMSSHAKAKTNNRNSNATMVTVPRGSAEKGSRNGANKESLKEEHMVAAKRMFALALGRQGAKDGILSKNGETKQIDR